MVQKVDTLKWILTGIVNPDADFDSSKRFVRSRATGICIFYNFLPASFGISKGDRVTVAAGIRLSTWMVQKVDTLKWKLAGLVNPDADFDSSNRSGRSRAAGICLETL